MKWSVVFSEVAVHKCFIKNLLWKISGNILKMLKTYAYNFIKKETSAQEAHKNFAKYQSSYRCMLLSLLFTSSKFHFIFSVLVLYWWFRASLCLLELVLRQPSLALCRMLNLDLVLFIKSRGNLRHITQKNELSQLAPSRHLLKVNNRNTRTTYEMC